MVGCARRQRRLSHQSNNTLSCESNSSSCRTSCPADPADSDLGGRHHGHPSACHCRSWTFGLHSSGRLSFRYDRLSGHRHRWNARRSDRGKDRWSDHPHFDHRVTYPRSGHRDFDHHQTGFLLFDRLSDHFGRHARLTCRLSGFGSAHGCCIRRFGTLAGHSCEGGTQG